MAWLERNRAARIAGIGALVLMSVACSDDKKSTSDDDGDDNGENPPEGETDEDAATAMDARAPTLDARIVTPPSADAGDAGLVLADARVVVPPTPGSDASIPNLGLTPLPADGEKGSICYNGSECKTDDLTCNLPMSGIPGNCVDDCAADTDCPLTDGVKSTCNVLSGQCQFPCAGKDNKGDGACPDKMVCVDEGTTPLIPDWRCRYPQGGGKKTVEPWDSCDPTHANGDCEGLNVCHQPALSLASAALPHGYCVNVCVTDSDCKAPEGIKSSAICWFGTCELNCGVPGGNCPDGMNCMDIDPSLLVSTNRCIYIN